MNYIYKGDYAVLVNLVVSESTPLGSLPISVKSEWLACTDEICVPEQDELSITLQVVGKDAAVSLNNAFNGYREASSTSAGKSSNVLLQIMIFSVFRYHSRLMLKLKIHISLSRKMEIVDYAAEQKVNRDGDRLIIETTARGDSLDKISGILKIGDENGFFTGCGQG